MSRRKIELTIQVGNITWKYLASGSFNDVYWAVIDGQKMVYKIAQATTSPDAFYMEDAAMDTVMRSLRMWKEINPKYKAQLYEKGWIVPFIENQDDANPPTQKEICNAVIDIYQKTGRIVIDAINMANWKKPSDNEIVLIDVNLAIKLEIDEQSDASLNYWRHKKEVFGLHLKRFPEQKKISNILKALLVLQELSPDARNISWLKTIPDKWINCLVAVYDNFSKQLKSDILKACPDIDFARYWEFLPKLETMMNGDGTANQAVENGCNETDFSAFTKQGLTLIEKTVDKEKLTTLITGLIDSVNRYLNYPAMLNKKIKFLCDMAQAIKKSSLMKEDGFFGMGLFDKTGKTKSYQNAMKLVKEKLLELLSQTKTNSIPFENLNLVKEILGEHRYRGPHVGNTSSLADPAFQRHIEMEC